jgi:hypothetical protein
MLKSSGMKPETEVKAAVDSSSICSKVDACPARI